MSNESAGLQESHPMNGGDGTFSYSKNSYLQKEGSRFAAAMVSAAIAEKLDIEKLSSASNVFRMADLGCSVGPNTFFYMQNILEAVQHKYLSLGLKTLIPEFHLFFNDHAGNDFNTLFASLPPEKQYSAAGVPGSFYGRLFPKSSLHFVYSSFALQWLSKVPEEVLDKNSPAWNKGRIHCINAAEAVANAYTAQFTKDMKVFLDARAKEVVAGGMMVLITPSVFVCFFLDLLGSSLMNMAKEGLISEELVDSFNLPVYTPSPKEMSKVVEENDCFSIERMELANPWSGINSPIDGKANSMHMRANTEAILSKHFGSEIIDELFNRLHKKIDESSDLLREASREGTQLFVVLKRK
uniref:S-adenosylmethionine-dependent methyltransferase At5g37990 n=1 Tax=Bixa orellana TaxID=66672 RepID=A0A9Y0ZEU7_BIXOR|nr:putative S-adenosylmethionine-dependent methyltransferase At5g37990 [Bixa orellana]